jgi:hypothetical protein
MRTLEDPVLKVPNRFVPRTRSSGSFPIPIGTGIESAHNSTPADNPVPLGLMSNPSSSTVPRFFADHSVRTEGQFGHE